MTENFHNHTISLIAENASGFEDYFNDENSEIPNNDQKITIPETIGILPIRNAVIFPGTITPLAIGREKTKNLIDSIKPNKSVIGLVTQKESQTDTPGFKDIYKVGTMATVLKVIKMPQGSIHIVVHSLSRFKILKPVATKPFLKAKVEPLSTITRITKKTKALIVNVRNAANRVIELSPNVPEEASFFSHNHL